MSSIAPKLASPPSLGLGEGSAPGSGSSGHISSTSSAGVFQFSGDSGNSTDATDPTPPVSPDNSVEEKKQEQQVESSGTPADEQAPLFDGSLPETVSLLSGAFGLTVWPIVPLLYGTCFEDKIVHVLNALVLEACGLPTEEHYRLLLDLETVDTLKKWRQEYLNEDPAMAVVFEIARAIAKRNEEASRTSSSPASEEVKDTASATTETNDEDPLPVADETFDDDDEYGIFSYDDLYNSGESSPDLAEQGPFSTPDLLSVQVFDMPPPQPARRSQSNRELYELQAEADVPEESTDTAVGKHETREESPLFTPKPGDILQFELEDDYDYEPFNYGQIFNSDNTPTDPAEPGPFSTPDLTSASDFNIPPPQPPKRSQQDWEHFYPPPVFAHDAPAEFHGLAVPQSATSGSGPWKPTLVITKPSEVIPAPVWEPVSAMLSEAARGRRETREEDQLHRENVLQTQLLERDERRRLSPPMPEHLRDVIVPSVPIPLIQVTCPSRSPQMVDEISGSVSRFTGITQATITRLPPIDSGNQSQASGTAPTTVLPTFSVFADDEEELYHAASKADPVSVQLRVREQEFQVLAMIDVRDELASIPHSDSKEEEDLVVYMVSVDSDEKISNARRPFQPSQERSVSKTWMRVEEEESYDHDGDNDLTVESIEPPKLLIPEPVHPTNTVDLPSTEPGQTIVFADGLGISFTVQPGMDVAGIMKNSPMRPVYRMNYKDGTSPPELREPIPEPEFDPRAPPLIPIPRPNLRPKRVRGQWNEEKIIPFRSAKPSSPELKQVSEHNMVYLKHRTLLMKVCRHINVKPVPKSPVDIPSPFLPYDYVPKGLVEPPTSPYPVEEAPVSPPLHNSYPHDADDEDSDYDGTDYQYTQVDKENLAPLTLDGVTMPDGHHHEDDIGMGSGDSSTLLGSLASSQSLKHSLVSLGNGLPGSVSSKDRIAAAPSFPRELTPGLSEPLYDTSGSYFNTLGSIRPKRRLTVILEEGPLSPIPADPIRSSPAFSYIFIEHNLVELPALKSRKHSAVRVKSILKRVKVALIRSRYITLRVR